MWNILLILATSLLVILGLIGIIVPALPGVPLVFLGVSVYAVFTDFTTINWQVILLFLFLTLASIAIDYFSGLVGAKKLGATKYGIWGGLGGLLVGLIFSPFGLISLIVAPFLGTIVGELVGGKKIIESSKIGLGTLIGYLVAIILDLSIATWMIFIFIKAIF